MSELNIRQHKIAKRYGSVLFELSQERKNSKKITKDIQLLYDYLQEAGSEWAQIIRPTLSRQTQQNLIETLATSLKLDVILSHFLFVLAKHRRLPLLGAILEEFLNCIKKAESIVEGILETTEPLSNKEINNIQKALKLKFGKDVHIKQKINSDLLGGLVLRVESIMMDGSLKTQLNKLRHTMEG